MSNTTNYDDPKYYSNRELSWVMFNKRVLSEARDKNNPLFERLKFLSITSSNLAEFFMVRVASLMDMVNAGYEKRDIAGMTAKEQISALSQVTHELVAEQYGIYNKEILPGLLNNGLRVIKRHEKPHWCISIMRKTFIRCSRPGRWIPQDPFPLSGIRR